MKDLRFLSYLIALADRRHFAHAARSLGISQPALSVGIKRLETELGVRLFDRARGTVALTPFGEAALRHARGLVGSGAELVREIALLRGVEAGKLVIVAGTFPAEISGHRALGRVVRKHPGLQCRIELREWNRCAELLVSREADLALAEVSAVEDEPLIVAEPLNTQPGTFVCRPGHPVLKLKRPTLQAISAYPWALVPLPPRLYRSFGPIHPAAGQIDEQRQWFIPAIRVETLAGTKQVVQASDAIGAAPMRLIADEVRAGTLAVIRFKAPWLRLNYGFLYLRDRMLSPAARAFMAEVRAVEVEGQ